MHPKPEQATLSASPAVPPFLALYYATIARGPSLAWLCRAALVLRCRSSFYLSDS